MANEVSTQPRIAPYGSWASPVTADAIAAGVIGLSQIRIDGDDVYWVEQRPAEAGRNVVVRYRAGADGKDRSTDNVTPPAFNARTRVHEYGGGAYLVSGGIVWFTNYKDQRLYRQDPGAQPVPITPAGDIRHADMVLDAQRDRLIAVREDHTTGSQWAVNSIVAIPIQIPSPSGGGQGGRFTTLVAGNDFYASPRVSSSGSQLCWLTWNHPNMPWDGTELWVADLGDGGGLHDARKVAGGPDESIFQPTWSPSGDLYFMSDRTKWWNLYRLCHGRIEPVVEIDAELGAPQWVFGGSTYAFDSERRIVCQLRSKGIHRLIQIDTQSRRVDEIETPHTAMQPPSIQAHAGRVYTVAGSPTEPLSIIAVTLDSGRVEVLRRSDNLDINPGFISVPEAIEFPTDGGLTAHAFYYPPVNPDHQAPPDERPPLIVMVHGGPTGSVSNALDLSDQFWTSRGFAVVVVNYGGSTGYGRDYRERLYGKWGIVDVDDSINAARYLIDRGLVDGRRVAITGGSAGGYTVLRAVTVSDFFKAGAAYYGLSELEVFHADTHKFESRYDEHLIGRWPEDRQIYHDRSPIYSIDRISAPLILFQGLEDKIVPPKQSELIVEALRKKGLPVAYVAYEGEQHGFRIAKNIKRSLEAELYFYSRVFGFGVHDPVQPVTIENLD